MRDVDRSVREFADAFQSVRDADALTRVVTVQVSRFWQGHHSWVRVIIGLDTGTEMVYVFGQPPTARWSDRFARLVRHMFLTAAWPHTRCRVPARGVHTREVT